MQTLFISDIHLSAESAEIRDYFLHFLRHEAKTADALYILGDLFEVWIGDDDNALWIEEISQALKNLALTHTKLYLMQGNRDFLLGKAWASKCGAVLLPDPVVIDLYGTPTLLMHGDLLCTEDKLYQRWRKFVHYRFVQKFMLSFPLSWRQYVANKLRHQSQQYVKKNITSENSEKSAKMDVSLSTLEVMIKQYQVTQLIHGHTHRPAVHNAETYTRFVLPAWHPKGGMLSAKANETPKLIIF
jgi:UDP-2,3-diacylglucosamine hydrolase